MKNAIKISLSIMMCVVLLAGLASGMVAKADAESDANPYKTVRVGWFQSPMFQEGFTDGEIKSGYCYDYLQKVADYTNWKYEYVYGTWSELLEKLERGDIDFLGGVSETPERRQTMLFPEYAMGTDQYYIFKRLNDHTVSGDNLAAISDKKLGAIRNNRMTVMAEQWIRDNHLDDKIHIVYYEDMIDQEQALKDGSVDLIVKTISNVLNLSDIEIVSKVGEEPFYLAINNRREELLTELNDSLAKIISIDPFVLQNLQYKNYGANLINKTLSDDERDWVNSHKTVIVGYLDNYLPYSSTDEDGRATGLLTDVFTAIVNSLGLDGVLIPEYRAYGNYGDMMDALKCGEIHTAFPVYGNLWDLEQSGINASSEVVLSSEAFFHKGTYKKSDIRTIAINRNNDLQQAYCKRVFPVAKVIYGGSIEECLDMVIRGEADGTIVNTLRTELVTRNSKYRSLSFVQLDIDDSRCFGVNEGNVELLTLLNRGLRVISSSYGIDNAYKYMEELYQYGFADFVRANILWIVLIAGVIGLIIITLLVVGLKRKASEVRQKEESVRQANAFSQRIELLREKADRANAAKTQFLNNMSHDIRTPMNAIIGYTDIAQKYPISGEVKTCLDRIRDSSEHLLSLVNDILDISRIESGTVRLNTDVTDISAVTQEALTIVKGFLADRQLDFETEQSVSTSTYVVTDALKIREILVNLIGNAVKFTDDGGKIRFTYTLNGGADGHVIVRYTVSDTGRGMSEEFQNHIFEEFSQENNGARTQYKGTGLGLTITKRYIDMLGGTISFVSRQNKGTTFTVELPLLVAAHGPAEKAKEPECLPDVRGIAVLLAEDNDLNAEITQIQLQEAGIIVTRVTNGNEAVAAFRDNPAGTFSVILMDIMMPGMDGYGATEAIRTMEGRADGATIPIIAMTANAFTEDVQKSLESGMTAHLTKPVKAQELIKIVAQATVQ